MKLSDVKKKYAETLRKLHICGPAEKAGLKALLDYYYQLLH